ncbi:MAG: GDSL-type esterase/lipase family protein [Bacteroidales bacterium]|nr:GDSL-type esterase/lipase family protein [Bacteroidales bacterium]
MMKKTLLIIFFVLLAAVCRAETIDGCDARVTYVGRTCTEDGAVFFDWSATTVKVKFTGSVLNLHCADTHADWFNVWIDKEPSKQEDARIKICSRDTTIQLFKGRRATHEVILQKRTEGEQGTAYFIGFSTDGKFLQTAAKPRIIEFVGDSYTCGYGTEGLSRESPFLPEEENPALTYAAVVSRYFGAEAVHISHSGRGVARNYGDFNQHESMVSLYTQTFDQFCTDRWTPSYKADVVVVFLGTNDFSIGKQPLRESWNEKFCKLLHEIRDFHPGVPIICLASTVGEDMDSYVENAVRLSGLPNVKWFALEPGIHNDSTDLGAVWHPNYNGQRKTAFSLIPYIATATGWEMSDIPVK